MHTSSFARLALVLLLTASLAACDSGADEAAPAEELTAMFADLQSALTLAFSAGKTAMPDLNCPQGGTLTVTNNGATGNSFNRDLAYNNCNGLNGALNMRGTTAFTQQTLTYNVTLNGDLSKQCDLSIDDFNQVVETSFQNPQNATITLNGSMSAQCASGSATCTFDDVTYTASSGAAALAGHCR